MNNKTRFYIAAAAVFVAFSVIAFVPPFVMNGTFWVSYIFGVIAIALQLYAYPKAFAGKSQKSKFYGFPIAKVATIYLIAQLALSLIFIIAAKFIPTWVAVIVGIILLCAAAIGLVGVEIAREEVHRQDVQVKKDTTAMRAMQVKVKALADICPAEVKAELEKLAESFRFSDPVTNDATKDLEAKLSVRLEDLSDAIAAGNTDGISAQIVKLSALLAERNAVCKMGK